MNITHLLTFIIYLLSLVSLGTLIGVLIIGARRQAQSFINLISILFIWLLPQFFAQFFFSDHHFLTSILIRSSLFFAGFVVPALTLFVKDRLKTKNNKALTLLAVLGPILGILSALPINPLNISASSSGIAVTSSLPLYNLLIDVVFLDFIVAIITIWRREVKNKKQGENVRALRSLRYALTVAIVLNIIGAFFLAKYQWSQVLTPLSMALMAGMTYIAIFQHRLFDLHMFVARSVAYLLTVIVMGGLYGWLSFGIIAQTIFKGAELTIGQQLLQILLVIIMIFSFRPIKLLFDRATNRIFYRDSYDPQAFLDQLNKVLVSNIDLGSLIKDSAGIIVENIKVEFCAFDIDPTEHIQRTFYKGGDGVFSEENSQDLRKALNEEAPHIISVDDLGNGDTLELFNKYHVGSMIKLTPRSSNNGKTLGYLILGQKKSGNSYTGADIKVLSIVANELVIAIQNALRFEEIKNFNITLQGKVDDATYRLRKTNEKLRQIDETKDEFISMASHQLRTPLTSMKGYVSMVMDGDAGKLSSMQHKLLDQAFISSQRMVYLISDLLNVSRLKTGKFIIEAKPTNLAEVIDGEIAQLKETAKSRDLELTYSKPHHFPVLNVDEMKLRQVIMNFVDNAIYYTPAGGHINVKLVDKPDSIECTVTDDGIGVPQHERHHLFTKFYRADNAKKARPDGTGLGLFMAQKVIVAQGGAIIFQSQEGKGSTFGFSLPKARLLVTKDPMPPAHKAVAA